MSKVLIAGYGIVGENVHTDLIERLFKGKGYRGEEDPIRLYDPPKGMHLRDDETYDICYVCVPTPMLDNGACDTSYVRQCVQDLKDVVDVFILKSTVPPDTTDTLAQDLGINIFFSPEYYGETIHANGVVQDFVILGRPEYYKRERGYAKAVQHLQSLTTGNTRFYFPTNVEAELVKYMENAFLATKVTFCNDFYRLAQRYGADYNVIREMFVADSRVNPSHTFVYPETPWYNSKCLNKDVPAIVEVAKSKGIDTIMQDVISLNNQRRGID